MSYCIECERKAQQLDELRKDAALSKIDFQKRLTILQDEICTLQLSLNEALVREKRLRRNHDKINSAFKKSCISLGEVDTKNVSLTEMIAQNMQKDMILPEWLAARLKRQNSVTAGKVSEEKLSFVKMSKVSNPCDDEIENKDSSFHSHQLLASDLSSSSGKIVYFSDQL